MLYCCNPSSQQAERPHREFVVSLGYMRPHLKAEVLLVFFVFYCPWVGLGPVLRLSRPPTGPLIMSHGLAVPPDIPPALKPICTST